jgi:hypothetical protein
MEPNANLQEWFGCTPESFMLEVSAKINLFEVAESILQSVSRNDYTTSDVIAMMTLLNTKNMGEGFYHDPKEWENEE